MLQASYILYRSSEDTDPVHHTPSTYSQDLWAARSRLPVSLQSTSAFRSILSALLMTNWHRGDGKDLFNTKTGKAAHTEGLVDE